MDRSLIHAAKKHSAALNGALALALGAVAIASMLDAVQNTSIGAGFLSLGLAITGVVIYLNPTDFAADIRKLQARVPHPQSIALQWIGGALCLVGLALKWLG